MKYKKHETFFLYYVGLFKKTFKWKMMSLSNSIPVNKMQNFAFKILVYLLLEAQLSKSNIAIIRP